MGKYKQKDIEVWNEIRRREKKLKKMMEEYYEFHESPRELYDSPEEFRKTIKFWSDDEIAQGMILRDDNDEGQNTG